MTSFNQADYKTLDRHEILTYLFHPRPEAGTLQPRPDHHDVMIPVDKNTAIGGCFHVKDKALPNILFFHGNGEIVADYDMMGPVMNQYGLNFLPVDYRGYGRSGGSPSVSAMMHDCHVILDFVEKWLAENDCTGALVLMGRSLGSASALELASHYPQRISALVVESGFAYTEPLLRILGINTTVLGFNEQTDGFGNLDKINAYDGPTLIIHAEKDHIISFSDGQALYDTSPAIDKTFLKIPGANHNDIFLHGFSEYMEALTTLAKKPLTSIER